MIGLAEDPQRLRRRAATRRREPPLGSLLFKRYGMPFAAQPRARVCSRPTRGCRTVVATRLLVPRARARRPAGAAVRVVQHRRCCSTRTTTSRTALAARRGPRRRTPSSPRSTTPRREAAYEADRDETRQRRGRPHRLPGQGPPDRRPGALLGAVADLRGTRTAGALEAGGFQPIEAYDVLYREPRPLARAPPAGRRTRSRRCAPFPAGLVDAGGRGGDGAQQHAGRPRRRRARADRGCSARARVRAHRARRRRALARRAEAPAGSWRGRARHRHASRRQRRSSCADGATGADAAAAIGPGLARAALAIEVRRRRRRDAELRDLARPLPDGADALDHHLAQRRRGAGADPPRRRPRARHRRARALRGREDLDRPADRRTASTTTSSSPTGCRSARPTSRRSKSACASTSRPAEPFVRDDVPVAAGARALRRRGPGLQGRADRRPRRQRRPSTPCRLSRCTRTGRSPTSAAGRTPPRTGDDRRLPADLGRRRLLARGLDAHDAHAHLRHRVLLARPSSRSTSSASSRRALRDHRKLGRELGAVHVLRRLTRRRLLAARRHGDLQRARRLSRSDERRARLQRGQDAADLRRRAVADLGPLGQVPRAHVPARGRGPRDGASSR